MELLDDGRNLVDADWLREVCVHAGASARLLVSFDSACCEGDDGN